MGRILIGVGLVLLVVVGAALYFVLGPGGQTTGGTDGDTSTTVTSGGSTGDGEIIEEPTEVPTSIPVVELVIAVQELPRGFRIPANALAVRPWPLNSAPDNGITNVEDVVNRIARTDIFRGQPILTNMLVDDFQNLADDLARVGSDAAAVLPSSLVAVAMPIDRLTSVAYAIQPGDRVDIIVSMLFVDVDEAFQSIAPNTYRLIREIPDGLFISEQLAGRPDQITLGNVIIQPSEYPRPRLLTQRTIQDALVVQVGEFRADGLLFEPTPTPTPVPAEGEAVEGEEEAAAEEVPPDQVLPTPTPVRPDIVTLGVTPQEAVLLVWAIESRLPLTLALRSVADTSSVPTEAVTLDVFMSEYRITVPGKREYTIEPALRTIRQLDLRSTQINIAPPATDGDN